MDDIILVISLAIICVLISFPLMVKAALNVIDWWLEKWAEVSDDIKTFISNRKDNDNGNQTNR